MKAKPRPKELLIEKAVGDVRILRIYVHSEDAKRWIESEAPEFGIFHWSDVLNHYVLIVTPTFDFGEVFEYLDSYNAEQEQAT